MMLRRAVAVLAVCGLVLGLGARAAAEDKKANVTGTWTWEFKTQGGDEIKVKMTLKQEGDKLTGTVTARDRDSKIEDGTVKGDEISFNVSRERDGQKFTSKYKGKV